MDRENSSIAPLRSLTLELPPSCIEFCPAHPEYFVVGTYNLQKEEPTETNISESSGDDDGEQQTSNKPQSRNGSLVVYRLTEKSDISHVQTVSCPSALLDLHFHPAPDKHEVAAVVSSTGTLSFYRLSPMEPSSDSLKELATHKPLGDDNSVLFLSCAWHPTLHDLLAITTSDHRVHILRVDDSWCAHDTTSGPIITHTLEAWTVAFSPYLGDPSLVESDADSEGLQVLTVFSGGDDSNLLSTSCLYRPLRTSGDDEVIEATCPTAATRGHEAGVTAILPLALKLADGSRVVVTGSYDDCLRVYSIYPQDGGMMLKQPKMLAGENLGGGVWRLKLIRLEDAGKSTSSKARQWTALVLASCMHAGSRVLEVTGDYGEDCQVRVLAHFEEHKSMNYGSDFQPGSELSSLPLRCVSTSFYDRLLCLWES
ncbi:Uu.00g137690.m01.CDS01 [Anthostomella pinea]|uniref:Uu.00g137690.m01.CDS01 n=1 Tax=Anthostomella pinea TaxID=933095 RepID=A0AAI8VQH9_9PEZI|nr:Uu.00g137690.m01.CDS01 [Anthostomella pinea]